VCHKHKERGLVRRDAQTQTYGSVFSYPVMNWNETEYIVVRLLLLTNIKTYCTSMFTVHVGMAAGRHSVLHRRRDRRVQNERRELKWRLLFHLCTAGRPPAASGIITSGMLRLPRLWVPGSPWGSTPQLEATGRLLKPDASTGLLAVTSSIKQLHNQSSSYIINQAVT